MPLIVLVVPLGELPEKVIDQQRDVLAPLAQRRQVRSSPPSAGNTGRCETCRRRSASSRLRLVAESDAHVDLDRLVVADAGDLAALQHAQQLDLRGHRHVADFVEEQRAAVGVLELADAVASRRR